MVFGIKLLWEAKGLKGGEASDELREAEEELMEAEKLERKKNAKKRNLVQKRNNISTDIELGYDHKSNDISNEIILGNDIEDECAQTHLKGKKIRDRSWNISVLFRSFAMTFISEIGDRSQITTIVLASHKSPYGVTVGAALGHAICTAIAVMGGKVLASRISERNVTLIGGLLFLAFSVESFIYGPVGD